MCLGTPKKLSTAVLHALCLFMHYFQMKELKESLDKFHWCKKLASWQVLWFLDNWVTNAALTTTPKCRWPFPCIFGASEHVHTQSRCESRVNGLQCVAHTSNYSMFTLRWHQHINQLVLFILSAAKFIIPTFLPEGIIHDHCHPQLELRSHCPLSSKPL